VSECGKERPTTTSERDKGAKRIERERERERQRERERERERERSE